MYIQLDHVVHCERAADVAVRLLTSSEEAIDLQRFELDKRILVTGSRGVISVNDLLHEEIAPKSRIGFAGSTDALAAVLRRELRAVADDPAVARREEQAARAALILRRQCTTACAHSGRQNA